MLTVVASCSKYEDGPAFSLLSKKERLCGDWELETALYNDVDYTASFLTFAGANYRVDIEKDGGYRIEGANPDEGTWEFGEDKDDVRFKSNNSSVGESSYRILRLKSKELWVKQTQTNGDVIELHYKSE